MMTKKLRDDVKQQAANFNYAIVDLFNLPDEKSFQLKRYSSTTLTVDIKDENLISFLQENEIINHYETRSYHKKLGVTIFGARIGRNRLFYGFDLCSAIREALGDYESKEKIKNQVIEQEPMKHEDLIIKNVINQDVLVIDKRKEPKLKSYEYEPVRTK
jgi:hypothetical protein